MGANKAIEKFSSYSSGAEIPDAESPKSVCAGFWQLTKAEFMTAEMPDMGFSVKNAPASIPKTGSSKVPGSSRALGGCAALA